MNGDPITAPASSSFSDSDYPNIDYPPRQTPTGDVIRSLPPQCSPDRYDGPNAGTWGWNKSINNNFNDGWFTNNNDRSVADPLTAEPLAHNPPPMDTLVTAIIPGITPPPFVPVPHSETITNTTTVNPIRKEASEWWKVWLLLAALLLLLSVILLAMFCGPKERIRLPIKRVEEEIPILVEE